MESNALRYVSGTMSKEDYLATCLAEIDLSEQCRGLDGCESFVKGKLSAGFWALDKLDRNDPFWRHTNKLPTLNKLGSYATRQISDGTDLVNSAWVLILYNLYHCSQHLEVAPWRILQQHNSLDAVFLVRTACNSAAYWGDDSVGAFAELVRELDLDAEVGSDLDRLAESGSDARQWVDKVNIRLYPT